MTKWNIIKRKSLLTHIKKGQEILTFSDIEIDKNKFYYYKSPVPLRDVIIEKVSVFNKSSFSEKTINTLLVTCIMIIKLSLHT